MDLVLDIGNHRIKGAFFQGDTLLDSFRIAPKIEALQNALQGKPIEKTLISSVNSKAEGEIKKVFDELGLPFNLLDFSEVKVILDVDEPDQLGHDRIANVYGALHHFPVNDCIVVDLGTAVTFDYVGKDGRYVGGAIYPGVEISAKALDQYTDKLPEVEVEKPESAVAKTTKTHIQSGLYWGLLGAIERITSEMRFFSVAPSNVKVIATGGTLSRLSPESFSDDLEDLVDLIDPELTLIGLHEILKEMRNDCST